MEAGVQAGFLRLSLDNFAPDILRMNSLSHLLVKNCFADRFTAAQLACRMSKDDLLSVSVQDLARKLEGYPKKCMETHCVTNAHLQC